MEKITSEFFVYEYKELSEDAKQKAIEKERESRYEDNIYSILITESFTDHLENHYFLPSDDLEWSLSHCQGDGVAFYGKIDIDQLEKLINKYLFLNEEINIKRKKYILNELVINNMDINIVKNGFGYHYSHWNTMNLKYEIHFDEDKFQRCLEIVHSFIEWLEKYIKDTSREMEKNGYDQLDSYYSEESILEDFKENETKFLENGSFYY